VQGVAELMEHGGHLIEGEQHRLPGLGLGDVEVVGHHRFLLQQSRLADVRRHPRSALLVVAREVVGEKQRERLAIGIEHLEDSHVLVVDGQIVPLAKIEPVELMGCVEDAVLQDVVELEVRSDGCLIEVVACLAHLL
jgi:hypothetical protein